MTEAVAAVWQKGEMTEAVAAVWQKFFPKPTTRYAVGFARHIKIYRDLKIGVLFSITEDYWALLSIADHFFCLTIS